MANVSPKEPRALASRPCADVLDKVNLRREGFTANVSIPLQMPSNPRLHLPLPAPKQASLGAAASALQEGIEIRERGCDCVVWPAGPNDDLALQLRHGVLSVELAASPVAERLGQEEDTVVLELAAGSYSFLVGAG